MEKEYYFISNSDNQIYKSSDIKCKIQKNLNYSDVQIEILSDDDEVIDTVNGYETLGDLYESMNQGNDVE